MIEVTQIDIEIIIQVVAVDEPQVVVHDSCDVLALDAVVENLVIGLKLKRIGISIDVEVRKHRGWLVVEDLIPVLKEIDRIMRLLLGNGND